MASTGDAPPPPPQPEEITPEVLQRLASSSITAESLFALTKLRDDPQIYTEVAPELYGLFTRSLLSDDAPLRSMSREAFLALAEHVGRVGDVLTINSLFAPLSRYIISSEDLPSERPDDGSTLLTLTALAAAVPQALVPHITAIVALCHETVIYIDNDPATRQKSFNLLESLSENLSESIPDKSLPDIVDSCLAAMSNIDWGTRGDQEWHEEYESNENEEASWGKDCLEQIVFNLYDRRIVKATIEQTCDYLQDGEWQCRLAGVEGLEVIGTTGLMMDEIIITLSHALSDPDARIRGAACNVLSLVAHNIGPNPGYLDDIVPLLINSMADSVQRVAFKASEALLKFIELCPMVISANLDSLISSIVKTLAGITYMTEFSDMKEQHIRTQLDIVKTMASASIQRGSPAESLMLRIGIQRLPTSLRLSNDQVAGIYDRFIEPLKLMLPKTKYLDILVLDCISRLVIAVGRSKFSADAPFVLHYVVIRLAYMDSDDCVSALTSLRGICLAMGDEMVPFLPLLMQPLIHVASYQDPGTSWNRGGTKEKCIQSVTNILVDFAKDHKEAFAPYVQAVFSALCSNMKAPWHRPASMEFGFLLDCVKDDGVAAMRALWVTYLTALKGVVGREEKKPFSLPILHSFVPQVITIMLKLGAEGLSKDDVDDISFMIKDALVKRSESDKEYAEQSITEFESLLSRLIVSLLEIAGDKAIDAVDSLVPLILTSMRNTTIQMTTVAEYACYAPQMALAHYDRLSQLILSSICDDRSDVRYEGFYAIRVIAAIDCPQWSSLIDNSFPSIIAALSREDARLNEECIRATTRAIMAVAMIIFHRTKIDLDRSSEIIPLAASYVEWLLVNEVREDDESSSFVYSVLAGFVRVKNPLVIGERNVNWSKIIRIMSGALTRGDLGTTSYGDTVKDLMIEVLNEMKCEDEQHFNDSVSRAGLSGEESANLHKILT